MSRPKPPPLLLPAVIALTALAFAIHYFYGGVIGGVGAVSVGRTALMLGAIWFAWPSLQKPVNWLPPGIAAVILLAIVAVAMQPRMALVVIPAVGGLITLASFVRMLR